MMDTEAQTSNLHIVRGTLLTATYAMLTQKQAPVTNLRVDAQHHHPELLLSLFRLLYTVVLYCNVRYVVQHTTHLFIMPSGLPIGVRHGELVHIREQRLQTQMQSTRAVRKRHGQLRTSVRVCVTDYRAHPIA